MSSGSDGKVNDVGPVPTVLSSDSGVGEEGLLSKNESNQDVERLVRIERFQCFNNSRVCVSNINLILSLWSFQK